MVGPHVRTWRPYTLCYVGLVGVAGLAVTLRADPGRANASTLSWCGAWLVPTLGWLAGHYGGDYFDRRLDATAKPHRPIPSGRMRPATALAGMVVCASVGAVLAAVLNWRTMILVAAALAVGIGYSTLFKARGMAGHLARGGLTAGAVLFGAMTVRDHPPVALALVAAVFWAHDAATNLVGALRDVDTDRAAGCRTFPVRHGPATTLGVAGLLGGVAMALAVVVPVALGPAHRTAFWVLLAGATAVLGSSLVGMTGPVRAGRPLPARLALRGHEILVLERLVLAGAFVGLATGPWPALALVLPATLVSGVLQASMRAGYEFGSAGRAG